jgi:hypothetical protein
MVRAHCRVHGEQVGQRECRLTTKLPVKLKRNEAKENKVPAEDIPQGPRNF